MDNKQLKIIREMYKQELKKNKEIVKLLSCKSTNRYIEIMGYEQPIIMQNEDIMDDVLKKIDIDSSKKIYINQGLYLLTDEDSIFFSRRLIKETDKNIISKMIDDDFKHNYRTPLINSSMEYILYDLENGKSIYKGEINKDDKIYITLPSLKKIISNLNDYGTPDCKFFYSYERSRISEVARYQFFIKLIYNNYNDVLSYYANQDNWQEIENDINKYFENKKKLIKK